MVDWQLRPTNMQPGPTQCTIGDQLGVATGQKPQDKFLPINQLDALAVDLCRVASLVQRLGRVSSSPAPILLKYCNLLMIHTHAYLFVYGSAVTVV